MAGGAGGSLDIYLQQALAGAGATAQKTYKGLIGDGQPAFNEMTEDFKDPDEDRFNRQMEQRFNFEEMANQFGSSGEETTLGGVSFMQLQYGILAQMARDQRLRKRTRLAQYAHAAVRLKAIDVNMRGPTTSRLVFWMGMGDSK